MKNKILGIITIGIFMIFGLTALGEKQADNQHTSATSSAIQKLEEMSQKNTLVSATMPQGNFTPGSWTLAILPDTQKYSSLYHGLYYAQTCWLIFNRDKYDIRYVLHLGDITQSNRAVQWTVARDAMSILDNKIPYAIVGGNHDYGVNGSSKTRDTLLNEYFPPEKYIKQPTFGGVMEPEKIDSSYHLFEAGGRKWIIIAIEWSPRDETVAWANGIMEKYPDRCGILITHAYIMLDDQRLDNTLPQKQQRWNPHSYDTPSSKNDGQELWDKLVRKHRFLFTINGHSCAHGTGYLASKNDLGNTVHQILCNYQMRELGGEAYMRLMEFLPDGKTVRIRTYSPLYNTYMTQDDQNFAIILD